MSRLQLVVILFLGSLLASCVVAAEHDMEVRSFKDKIIALTDEMVDAFAKHDYDAVMGMWHPDGYVSVEGIPLAHGTDAIRENLKKTSSSVDHLVKTYVEVGPNEEGADYVYVLYNEKLYDQADKLFDDRKCLLVWRKTDAGYKASFLMINSNE